MSASMQVSGGLLVKKIIEVCTAFTKELQAAIAHSEIIAGQKKNRVCRGSVQQALRTSVFELLATQAKTCDFIKNALKSIL